MLIRLADRKGLLKGDLNSLQERALFWLLNEEFQIQTELEKERMKYTLLSGNPQLYDQLYNEDEDKLDDSEVEWMVPESIEEVEDILAILNSSQQVHETGI